MTCSVNLVPTQRLHARARSRRRRTWFGVWTGIGVVIVAGWAVQGIAGTALRHLSADVRKQTAQRTAAQRQLMTASAQRAELLEQLETLAAARRAQPWPARLTVLAREAPDGVFLTGIRVGMEEVARDAGRAGRQPPQPAANEIESVTQPVRLAGYALDHAALLQLVNTLQAQTGWQQVELVRATREPFRNGQAVAFELDCRASEDVP